jgi:hypothetical protein
MPGFSTAPGTYVSNYTQVTSQFVAAANGTGFNAGDVLQKTQTFNPATVPPTVLDTTWSNLTQQTTGLAAPATSSINPGGIVKTVGYVVTTSEYRVTIANNGNLVGDIIQEVTTYDTSTTPITVVNRVYNNLNTVTDDVTVVLASMVPVATLVNQIGVVSSEYVYQGTATANYNPGDLLEAVYTYNISATPSVLVNTVWNNITTNTFAIATAPVTGDLAAVINPPYQVLSSNYIATAASPGKYAIGDILQQRSAVNYSDNTLPTVTYVWYNLTTQSTISGAIPSTDISPVDSQVPTTFSVITNNYSATATVVGQYTIGDILQNEQKLNTSTTPPTVVSSTWVNLTTGSSILVPTQADILPVDTATTTFAVITNNYYATAAVATQYAIGDVLQNEQKLNTSVTPPTVVSSTWVNLTTGNSITVPTQTNILPIGTPVDGFVVITNNYYATAAVATQYAINDVLQNKQKLNVSVTPPTVVSSTWVNLTAGSSILVPTQTDILPVGTPTPSTGFSIITNNYYAIATVATQYTIGDVVQNEQKLSTATTPPTIVSSTWVNLTTGSSISTPLQTNLLPVGTPAATTAAAGAVTNLYSVITGFAQGNAQDIVENVISYNLTTNPPTKIGSVWNNVTQNVTGITAPTITNLAALNTPLAEINKISSTAMFLAKAVSAGNYAVGDIIQKVVVWDTYSSPAPTAFSVTYNNLTSGANNVTVNLAQLTALGGALANPATIYSSQLTVAITATQGASQTYQNGVVLTADGGNLLPIYIGGDNTVSATTGYPLVAGQSISYGVSNLNAIWYIGLNATDILHVTGN